MQQIELHLLGTGQSGKSTLFRQLEFMYGEGYWVKEKETLKSSIVKAVYRAFVEVFDVAATRAGFRNTGLNTLLNDIRDCKPFIDGHANFSQTLAANIRTLWMTEEVQETWSNRSQYQFMESLEYYIGSGILDKFVIEDWIPNKTDIIHLKWITSGIIRTAFKYNEVMFKVIDHGGTRVERKGWTYSLDDVSAIMYVVDVSDFDEWLWEDSRVNRLEEAVHLFRYTLRMRTVQGKPVVLVFSKIDLLDKKLKRYEKKHPRVNLDEYFPTLGLGTTWNAHEARHAVLYDITRRFMDIARLEFRDTEILPQYISAMDEKMCKEVFESTANIALLNQMEL